MSRQTAFAGVIVALFLIPFSLPARSHAFMEDVVVSRLDNGMKVILVENHKAPLVTFQVWYRAGSRNDSWGKTGLAHVFEHLMFKGTEQVSKEEFTRRVQEIGGDYNAFTSHDYVAYFENVAADHVGVPIGLEADRLQNLKFREDEFKTERMVVMEERRLRTQDQPAALLMEQVDAAAFQAQPYHWPVIGWMGDLERVGYEDALRFYKSYYDPANAFIVAVGDFQKGQILDLIRKAFGPVRTNGSPGQTRYQDPPQMGERRVQVTREAAGLPYVILGYPVPNLQDADGYPLEVVSALLSGGRSSRIYESLILTKRLAVSAGAQYSLLSIDPSLFYLQAQPLPGKEPAELEAALQAEIERMQNEPVSPRELRKAKNQLEAAFTFGQDSTFYQGMLLARYEIVTRWEDIRKYLPGIQAVTAEDVQRVARKYFTKRNRTVGVLLSEKGVARGVGPSADPTTGKGVRP